VLALTVTRPVLAQEELPTAPAEAVPQVETMPQAVAEAGVELAPVNLGSVPVRIDIPRLGTRADIVPLGLEEDGAMAAPTNPDQVGWFELGPGVGGPGNMLLDGHVDWGGRLRVFGLLKTLQPGDDIVVTDANGVERFYSVVWVQLYDANTELLDEIFPTAPDEQLTLITCGGTFNQAIHMYLSRWIVRAAPIPTVAQIE
jgi:sortase (surface protein transpeptidase)